MRMEIEVEQISKEDWRLMGEHAHRSTFAEKREAKDERIDFALIAVLKKSNLILGYVTCREVDSETVYWQYGGSFHDVRASIHNFKAYCLMLDYCAERYKRMSTLIENTNRPMLKMAAKAGLLIVGVRNFKGKVLLEHGIEWEADQKIQKVGGQ